MRPIMTILSAAMLTMALSACKKNKAGNTNNCVITQYRDSMLLAKPMVVVGNMQYDADNKLSLYAVGQYKHFFRYNSGSIIVTNVDTVSGNIITDSALLNSKGRISAVFTSSTQNNMINRHIEYLYGQADQLVRLISNSDFFGIDTVLYEWNNGDMVKEIFKGDTTYHSYDNNQLAIQGDPTSLSQLLAWGMINTPCKHLCIATSTRQRTDRFYYSYIGNRISRNLATRTENDSTYLADVLTYRYKCR